ncbi:MAG: histidinol phosphate phosphatase [Rhodospirillaceae bacterium]|jgi:D-glycero-D-manno-heptose 1,7-bisphosphate phosphatase|nr:histidinol phosphate phosphatase [Rhodospirillaceae bacterium]|tara:strand:+ start:4127 stop:5362 length:1236 start_codon:yes stop_codon:yes gene_type:complete
MTDVITQAVILAGGLGVRLRPLTNTVPKPMIPVHERPFLDYLIASLRAQGIKRILLLLGYLPDVIQDYFGDGHKFGVEIEYSITDVENDTGTRVRLAEQQVDPVFILLYADNIWPLRLKEMARKFFSGDALGQLTVYSNGDDYSKNNNVRVTTEGRVVCYDKSRETPRLKGVDIGYSILRREAIKLIPEENVNFERTVYTALCQRHQLSAYITHHRYYSIGSHERLPITNLYLAPKRFIILDRDGVLNRRAAKAEYIRSWREFEWLPGSKEAVVRLTESGYSIIVVTNQAGIAHGKMSDLDVADIHRNILEDVEQVGGRIEKFYYCPHGWDEQCSCRKPRPGMLFEAQRDFNLDLSTITFIGDDERDMEAGEAAGCRTVLLDSSCSLLDVVQNDILIEKNLNHATMNITKD